MGLFPEQPLLLALASLAAALLYLETWAIGQFQLGRPAIVLPLVGLVAGQIELGLWMGLCLELLLLRELPLGATSPPDPAMGGYLGLLVVIPTAGNAEAGLEWRIFCGLLFAIGFSYLAGWHNHAQRQRNTRHWYGRFEAAVQGDQPDQVNKLFLQALVGSFLMAFGFAFLVLALLGPLAAWILSTLAATELNPSYFKWLVLATAIGTGLKLGTGRQPGSLTVVGWVAGAALLLALEGLAA